MPLIPLTDDIIFTNIRAILKTFPFKDIVPSTILQGQQNYIPEPKPQDFIVMWPIGGERLSFNIDYDYDNSVIGSITDNVLSVNDVFGYITPGLYLYNTNLPVNGVKVLSQLSPKQGEAPLNGAGTYQLAKTPNQFNQKFWCGAHSVMTPQEYIVQCDVHGPNSGYNVRTLSTLWRDDSSGTLARQLGAYIAPFYADGPRQMPFIDGGQNYEQRWTVDLHMQINPVVNVTQQFADQLQIETVALPQFATTLGPLAVEPQL